MATKNLVPRGDGEGGIGNSSRSWGEGHFKNLQCERSFSMPTTTTANRPTDPVTGTTVFDTDVGGLVIWNGSIWVEAGVPSPKTLALSVDPVGAGSVFGAGTYDKGADVSISATANTNYSFSQWEGDISNVRDVNQNPTLVTMSSSWVITAKFSVAQYDLTVNTTTGGTVTGTGSYDYGSTTQIEAIPDTANGYEFTGWTGDGIDDPSSSTTTVLIDGDKTVTANFALSTYDLIINTVTDPDVDGIYEIDTSGAIGSTTGAGTSIAHGSVVNITASVLDSSQNQVWQHNGVDVVSFEPLPGTTETWSFELTYHLSVQKVEPNTASKTLYVQMPLIDYHEIVNRITTTHAAAFADTGYSITAIGASSPDMDPWTPLVSVASGGESIYEFKGWEGSGITDPNSSSTTVTVTSDLTLNAKFATKTYTLDVSVADFTYQGTPETPGSFTVGTQNGVRSGAGPYIHSDLVYLAAEVDSNYSLKYEFSHWSGDTSVLDDPNSRTPIISSISSNAVLVANFKLVQFTVTVTMIGEGSGTFNTLTEDPSSPGTFSGEFDYGSVPNIIVTPNEGSTLNSDAWKDTTLLSNYNERFEPDPEFNPLFSNIATDLQLDLLEYNITITADNLSYTETSATSATWSSGSGGYSIITASPGSLQGTHGYYPVHPSSYRFVYKYGTVVTFTANVKSSYRFLQWTDVPGVDAESQTIEYTVTGAAELTFQVAKPPVSTFRTEGDLYFGETLAFTDISTAPSGDGTVVSSVYTNDQGLAFSSEGNYLRTFKGVQEYGQIEVSNPGDIMDLSKTWCVMLDWYGPPILYESNHHFAGLNRGETILGGLGPATSPYGFSFHTRWFQNNATVLNINNQVAGSNRFIYYCDGTTLYQVTLNSSGTSISRQTTLTASWDALNGSDTSKLYIGSGKNTSNMIASSSQITNQGFNIAANWNSVLFYDGSLPTDADMLEFLASEDGTDPTTYSFYGNLYDAIKCATKTYPSLNGEKGNIQAQFIEGSETQFKSFATLDLPIGSPGDITGSLDVTLTVTDDQGLTDTDTQTIDYGLPALNEDSDSDLSVTIVNDGGINVLSAPIILGAEIETTLDNGTIITKNK